MAILYTNKIKNTMANSPKLFQCSCFPIMSKTMIKIMVRQLVNKSHKIDVVQYTNKLTPLTYCKNRALQPFSYKFMGYFQNLHLSKFASNFFDHLIMTSMNAYLDEKCNIRSRIYQHHNGNDIGKYISKIIGIRADDIVVSFK